MKELILNKINQIKNTSSSTKVIPSILKNWITAKTNFDVLNWLNENIIGDSLFQKLFNLYNDIDSIPLCEQCKTQYKKFISFNKGYADYCCTKCHNILKYGVENVQL